jgi:hypothetical protein
VLDEPELLEEEQQRRLHTIEKHEAYIHESENDDIAVRVWLAGWLGVVAVGSFSLLCPC